MTTLLKHAPAFVLLVLTLVPSFRGYSQDLPQGEVLPPNPPYVGNLNGSFTFVKKITYKIRPNTSKLTDAQKSALKALSPTPDIQELDAVQTGTLRKDRQLFVDGTSMEIWKLGITRFLINLANSSYIEVAAVTPDGYQDTPDFQELNWITASSFQGEQMFQDKKCYVYKSGDRQAWIDQSNRLPLLFQSNAMQVSYTYGSPDERLQLPDKIVKRMQQLSRAAAGMPPN